MLGWLPPGKATATAATVEVIFIVKKVYNAICLEDITRADDINNNQVKNVNNVTRMIGWKRVGAELFELITIRKNQDVYAFASHSRNGLTDRRDLFRMAWMDCDESV